MESSPNFQLVLNLDSKTRKDLADLAAAYRCSIEELIATWLRRNLKKEDSLQHSKDGLANGFTETQTMIRFASRDGVLDL